MPPIERWSGIRTHVGIELQSAVRIADDDIFTAVAVEVGHGDTRPAAADDQIAETVLDERRRAEIRYAGGGLVQAKPDSTVQPADEQIVAAIMVPIDDFERGPIADVQVALRPRFTYLHIIHRAEARFAVGILVQGHLH